VEGASVSMWTVHILIGLTLLALAVGFYETAVEYHCRYAVAHQAP